VSGYVVILMGSESDLDHARAIRQALSDLAVEAVMRVASAHKTPAHALRIVEEYEADPAPKVYVTVAGRSNALSGFVDAQVSAPVIACPPYSDKFGGADVYSSLRMPGGVAPATVLEPAGAALLAAKMLGLVDPDTRERVRELQKRSAEVVLNADTGLQQED
jgi:5-(carboxyamino)imidazole ribonucleotide mutase